MKDKSFGSGCDLYNIKQAKSVNVQNGRTAAVKRNLSFKCLKRLINSNKSSEVQGRPVAQSLGRLTCDSKVAVSNPGFGKNLWDYFHIFCFVCPSYLLNETLNQGPEPIV